MPATFITENQQGINKTGCPKKMCIRDSLLDENNERMFDYGEYRPNSYAKYNLLASMPHDKSEINVMLPLYVVLYK